MERARLIDRLTQHIRVQSALCDALENMADALPDRADAQKLLHLARSVHPTIKRAHDFEEEQLFPLLSTLPQERGVLAETLDRLHYEHLEDEGFAAELFDEMIKFATGQSDRDPERLGYMLRGFFEGLRRHLAFEREHLLPILTQERVLQ